MKFKTVLEGEQAVIFNYLGEGRLVVGPARVCTLLQNSDLQYSVESLLLIQIYKSLESELHHEYLREKHFKVVSFYIHFEQVFFF